MLGALLVRRESWELVYRFLQRTDEKKHTFM
jgi:hypothetical protein